MNHTGEGRWTVARIYINIYISTLNKTGSAPQTVTSPSLNTQLLQDVTELKHNLPQTQHLWQNQGKPRPISHRVRRDWVKSLGGWTPLTLGKWLLLHNNSGPSHRLRPHAQFWREGECGSVRASRVCAGDLVQRRHHSARRRSVQVQHGAGHVPLEFLHVQTHVEVRLLRSHQQAASFCFFNNVEKLEREDGRCVSQQQVTGSLFIPSCWCVGAGTDLIKQIGCKPRHDQSTLNTVSSSVSLTFIFLPLLQFIHSRWQF